MIDMIAITAEPQSASSAPTWWTFLGGPVVGAAVATGALTLLNTIAGKKIKPATTVQSQTQALLEGLERMVQLMTEDKAKDAERIISLQKRIDELEADSVKDLDTIGRLHDEIRDLRAESARKDSTIRLLANELSSLGTIIHGLEESMYNTITFERSRTE